MKNEYELLDSGNGYKLERFGPYIISRPCSQAIWARQRSIDIWHKADASFDRLQGAKWHIKNQLPLYWNITIDDIKFKISSTDFGHLGIFPEQRSLWHKIKNIINQANVKRKDKIKVLNLFAYSGGATLAAALTGAHVCHLDASKGMVEWAKENATINKLEAAPIRWIIDDVTKFLKRQLRKQEKYEAIILDPPTFGRGNKGEVFQIDEKLPQLLTMCYDLLSNDSIFVLLSSHTPGYTPKVLENLLIQIMHFKSEAIQSAEMLITAENVLPIPSGAYALWTKN